MRSAAKLAALWATAVVCLLLAAFAWAVSWSDGGRTYAVIVVAIAVVVALMVQRLRSSLVLSVMAGAGVGLFLSIPTAVWAIINPL
jgi:hypothetical protein